LGGVSLGVGAGGCGGGGVCGGIGSASGAYPGGGAGGGVPGPGAECMSGGGNVGACARPVLDWARQTATAAARGRRPGRGSGKGVMSALSAGTPAPAAGKAWSRFEFAAQTISRPRP